MAGTIAGMSLVGRIALVSGGGSGIGKAVCKALSREGASVLIADKNKESAVATLKDLSSKYLLYKEVHLFRTCPRFAGQEPHIPFFKHSD